MGSAELTPPKLVGNVTNVKTGRVLLTLLRLALPVLEDSATSKAHV
jgi:hypothetical protein